MASRLAAENLESRAARTAPNLVRMVANQVMGQPDVIALWFGEPDVTTPAFIRQAAIEAIEQGDTFYTESLGRMYLREAVAAYQSELYSISCSASQIAVTLSGGNALNLAFQLLLQEGDKVVTTVPTFPNLLQIPAIQGAELASVRLEPSAEGWKLDIEELISKSSDAKVVLINSPNNPTGWVIPPEHLSDLVAMSRRTGCWIVADEVYSRLYFEGRSAPSILQFCEPEDRVIAVNSFSKAWSMTGWRLGWLTVPPSLMPILERIMEFSVSCAPGFVQRAATTALSGGEAFIAEQSTRYQQHLEIVSDRFSKLPRVFMPTPASTFYAYFRVEGIKDNVQTAHQIVQKARVGIAPGKAFDRGCEDWFRICVAVGTPRLEVALDRLETFFA